MAHSTIGTAARATETAHRIIASFQEGTIAKPMAQIFLPFSTLAPSELWSFTNRLITVLMGYSAAAGYKQWQKLNRHVKPGEKAFFIVKPKVKTKKVTKDDDEELEISYLTGFSWVPVFGYEQTEGEYIPEDPRRQEFIASLPLIDLAKSWGMTVETFDARRSVGSGYYDKTHNVVAIGVKNLSTWCHELIHKAEDRLGLLTKSGQDQQQEIVAELGGAVLLTLLGFPDDADVGGCWEYIQHYTKSEQDPLLLCLQLVDRTCRSVSYLLDEASKI